MCTKILFFVATLCVVNASVISSSDYNEEIQRRDDIEDSPTFHGCNNQECEQRCRRLKFPGGACVNGRCKCDNFRASEVDAVNETAEKSDLFLYRNVEDFASLIENLKSLRTCYPQECEQRCRRLKFPGGACVNGRCKCDNFLNSEDDAQSLAVFKDSRSRRICSSHQACDQLCRLQKFPGGACVYGRCKCNYFLTSEDFGSVIEKFSLRSCDPRECDQRCRRLKFPGGVCVNGRCKCDNFLNTEGLFTTDGNIDQAEESALTLKEGPDFEENKIVKRAVCYQYRCNDSCIRVGYAGGLCKKNHKCKCY